MWGVVWSGISVVIILAVFPAINATLLWLVVLVVLVSFGAGIALNLRARQATCDSGHSFVATLGSTRCPDCGQRYSDIKKIQKENIR